MLKKFNNRLSRATDWYHTYRKEIKLTSNIPITNKLLYQELEQECKKKGGVLTYAEYLQIDQFGKYGYYATSKKHGQTDVEHRWGKALANYCQKNEYDTLIEFGCGTGELGVATAKEYKKQTNQKLNWIGVEIDVNIHKKIYNNFASHHLQECVERIVSSIEEIPSRKHVLLVFPYSLDSIPPQIFINTNSAPSYPNALLGVTLQNGMLSEVVIPQEMLAKKGYTLDKGIFTDNHYAYKLTDWKLRKGQRAYLAPDAFMTLYSYVKKFGNQSTLIIIDELRKEPWFFNLDNFGTPKSLYEKNFVCYDNARYYCESGKHNLYYPLYKDTLLRFLHTIGFQSIEYEIEQKKAAQLRGEPWLSMRKNYATFAFAATNFVERNPAILSIPFSPQRI